MLVRSICKMSEAIMTVRELMKILITFNLDASVQVGDKDPKSGYTFKAGKIIYHSTSEEANPQDADYVVIFPAIGDE